MDVGADSGTLPAVGGRVSEQQQLSRCQTESGGTILLQLLEFKSQLLEAVEELHIRRDAETRFEDQIGKLVLEKQELEWEKESLQHQIETVAKQNTESLINVKKQLQAKIRNAEEEKGKYQVSAELKDKEINNLKEEMKSLQLLKYNLEKKSSELEQKLALQSRSKDRHLNQLGEVEKRFAALSRQCAAIKQAHEKLEQNVDEAMKMKKKLTTENEKQEATIVSLKKELEEVGMTLIKAKMLSVGQDKAQSRTGREQHCQLLHQRLSMETDMNKKLVEENAALRAEKQEVMRSLQNTQRLLLSQTQTVSRVELELQQALKQECRATGEELNQLVESCTASEPSWDKEKAVFLDRIEREQRGLRAVKEAYDELRREHAELSSQAEVQAQRIYELEMRCSGQSLSVSSEVFPTSVEEIGGKRRLDEPVFGSLQDLASAQANNPDCLEDTGAVTTPDATGLAGVSSPVSRSALSKERGNEGSGGRSEEEQGRKDDAEQVKSHRDEARGTLAAQTADTADRREDGLGSSEEAREAKRPKTETKDRAEEGGVTTETQTAETQIPVQTAEVVDFVDAEPAKPSDRSPSLSPTVRGKDADSTSVLLRPDKHPGVIQEVQRLQTSAESVSQLPSPIHRALEQTTGEEPAAGLSDPPNMSSICSSRTGSLPLAAQSDAGVGIQERETTQTQANMDEMCDAQVNKESTLARRTAVEPRASTQSQEVSEQSGQLRPLVTDGDDGGSSAYKKMEAPPRVDECGNYACEVSQDALETSGLKDDVTADTVKPGSRVETAGDEEHVKHDKMGDAKTTLENDASPDTGGTKRLEPPTAEETPSDVTNEFSLLSNKTFRSSFDWSSARGKTANSRTKSDVSVLQRFVQGYPISGQNIGGAGGLLRPPPSSAIPTFLKSKHNRVPSVITSLADLFTASGVSGTTRRHPAGEPETPETCRETAAAARRTCEDSRASFPISTSIMDSSRPSWTTAPGCSGAPTSAAGPSSESDWEPCCSQEREDQQSSFRAQISKIEQFLNTERLSLPKRRRTDN